MYKVNEIFLSVQGEGVRAGTLNVFLRFAHCNLQCNIQEHGFDCDTDFTGSQPMNLHELREAILEVADGCRSIILTGGEPALQADKALVRALREDGFYIAIETNGTKDITSLGLDWVTVSPKSAAHTIKMCKGVQEVKYVLGATAALPVTPVEAEHYLVSPAFEGLDINQNSLKWCIEIVKRNPTWRLSVQNHKFWRAR